MKRSAPLRRGAPLARKTRLKPRRSTPRRSSRVHDEPYLAAVRALPCISCSAPPPNDPHHAATWKRGLGQRCDDTDAVPLCRLCHDQLHDLRGRFAGFTKEQRIEWSQLAIEQTLTAVARKALAATKEAVPW